MTVLALVKFPKDSRFHLFGDGRVTQNDRIVSDKYVKTFRSVHPRMIWGICGDCSDMTVLNDIIEQNGNSKSQLLEALNAPENRVLLGNSDVLLVNENKDIIEINSSTDKEDISVVRVGLITWNEISMPLLIGSGSTILRAILAANRPSNSKEMKDCYKLAYTLVSSIGGRITEQVL